MKFKNKKLVSAFLNRIKTWDRPYNSLNFYYTPKLYLKLAEKNIEIFNKLNNLNKSLLNTITILDNNQLPISFREIEYIQTIGCNVYLKKYYCKRILLENFKIKKSTLSQITIDHNESLFSIIEKNIDDFTTLRYISYLILDKKINLDTKQMKNEYKRIVDDFEEFNIDLDEMCNEIEKLYSFKRLRLIPRSDNSSKGKN
ncbi:hypothetical protein [Empedobacter tilapiae]|uniref:Uncharacterized protein n=1 Tax=Empedobacter tilapiae TaxID=2491114 RepID=A0A4Z1BL14_9FLAO|nr:hypothetical protein [Empedobacter tilapiae]TGN26450.1 hypothetical protein E4J94_11525 [Empedobacter tilapiae]